MWASVLAQAERFGIPPWQFEEECTQEWWARIGAYGQAQAAAKPSNSQKRFLQRFMNAK